MNRFTAFITILCLVTYLDAQTGQFTDPRDGKVYKTVQISEQLWMAENLNYEAGAASWKYYNNDTHAATYGRLYDWETAKMACPFGWHLPSNDEWVNLVQNLGGEPFAGGLLKESGTFHWNEPNEGATNISGFSALPGGYAENGTFDGLGDYSIFWNSDSEGEDALAFLLKAGSTFATNIIDKKSAGYSVRCLNDKTFANTGTNTRHSYDSITDNRDGQLYKTLQIGEQTWMAENLNFNPGSNCWCYDNVVDLCKTYGRLYTWETAKKACPTGWHLPDDAEWAKLFDHLGGLNSAGGKMKEAGNKHWSRPNIATNASGFSALPGGRYIRNEENHFAQIGSFSMFWSLSENKEDDEYANYIYLVNGFDIYKPDGEEIHVSSGEKEFGLSVRCLKD